jgi:hypothetical protein
MDTSPPFPIFYLIGLGQTLGAILGEPLERASASSPDCVVIVTKDENGFEISQMDPNVALSQAGIRPRSRPQLPKESPQAAATQR